MELKNCPFCGEQPEMDHIAGYHDICCVNVFCKAHEVSCSDEVDTFAIKAWNTRATGWIAISERLPEFETEGYQVLAVNEGGHIRISHINTVKQYPKRYTHWMSIPDLPEAKE